MHERDVDLLGGVVARHGQQGRVGPRAGRVQAAQVAVAAAAEVERARRVDQVLEAELQVAQPERVLAPEQHVRLALEQRRLVRVEVAHRARATAGHKHEHARVGVHLDGR